MQVRKRLAGGAAVVTAGALPFVLGMPPAAAETKTAQHELNYEFTNNNGDSIVCRILGESSLTRSAGDPTFDSTSDTLISVGPSCGTSLTITARYTDDDGHARVSSASGLGTLSLRNDDVASGYVATHTITFLDCVNFCTTSFDTRPK